MCVCFCGVSLIVFVFVCFKVFMCVNLKPACLNYGSKCGCISLNESIFLLHLSCKFLVVLHVSDLLLPFVLSHCPVCSCVVPSLQSICHEHVITWPTQFHSALFCLSVALNVGLTRTCSGRTVAMRA